MSTAKIGNTNDKEARKAINFVLNKLYLGDWFVLYQLSKNTNMYFFRGFIKELRYELKEHPKIKKYLDKNKMDNFMPGVPLKGKEEGLSDDDIEKGKSDKSSLLSFEEANRTPKV